MIILFSLFFKIKVSFEKNFLNKKVKKLIHLSI